MRTSLGRPTGVLRPAGCLWHLRSFFLLDLFGVFKIHVQNCSNPKLLKLQKLQESRGILTILTHFPASLEALTAFNEQESTTIIAAELLLFQTSASRQIYDHNRHTPQSPLPLASFSFTLTTRFVWRIHVTEVQRSSSTNCHCNNDTLSYR